MVLHCFHPPEFAGLGFIDFPWAGGSGIEVSFFFSLFIPLFLANHPGPDSAWGTDQFIYWHFGERLTHIDDPGIVVGGRLVAIFCKKHLCCIGRPGVFITIGDLAMRKYDVFDGHLAKTFMELDALPDVESPSLGVCGDIPTLGQHRYDRPAVESSHP